MCHKNFCVARGRMMQFGTLRVRNCWINFPVSARRDTDYEARRRRFSRHCDLVYQLQV